MVYIVFKILINILDKDIVLEGCPTQDLLFVGLNVIIILNLFLKMTELNVCGSIEDKELFTQLSSKQSLLQLEDLRYVAHTMDPALL